ncbi:MAG: 2OG-Fe(II) oxygenase [Glaciimonas sp.]|nr:2OG-Fe(II) oxygenase [Glaciimonas sp.]
MSLPTSILHQSQDHAAAGGDNPVFTTCIAEDLVTHDWSYQTNFVLAELVLTLDAECRARVTQGGLARAEVGRGKGQAVEAGIRGDYIQWLDAGQSAAGDHYLRIMETLWQEINHTLYLGLEEFETHFAMYPPGTFYQKHTDRFCDDDRRTLSVILYLNPWWLPDYGGALCLHLRDAVHQDILPLAGSLALFLSAKIPHEVVAATRERLSLSGWFKRH